MASSTTALRGAGGTPLGLPVSGGRLGWIGRDLTAPEVEDTVLRLPAGLALRPLETRFGWHVVEVLDTRPGQVLRLHSWAPRSREAAKVAMARLAQACRGRRLLLAMFL